MQTHWNQGHPVSAFFNVTFLSRVGGIAGLLGLVLGLLQYFPLVIPVSTIEIIFLIWLAGVYAFQSPRLGRLGALGFGAAAIGLAGIIGINLLQQAGDANSRGWVSALFANPAVPWVFTAIVVLLVWGIIALGTTSLQAGVLPRGAIVLWMIGAVTSPLSSWPPVLLVIHAGVLWTSIVLLRGVPVKGVGNLPEVKPVPPPAAAASVTGRLLPLDALRGIIMILMAIDHASLFIRRWHPFETWDQPLPDYPSLAAMLTRLATHPCAPGFFFLMGAGMILFAQSRREQGWSERRIAGHLALRGLVFIALEQLIVDLVTARQVNPLDFSILAGLGTTMLFGILFLRLNGLVQAAAGALILLISQLLPALLLHADLGNFSAIRLLILPGSVGSVFVLYAPIPWLGVALLGMAFARLLLRHQERAYRVALVAGLACLVLFPLVRALGGFGNLRMPLGDTLVDFFNVVKYPPSLSFLLLSLGFDLVVLFLLSRIVTQLATWVRPVVILGQAALYFFLAHWFVYAAMGLVWNNPGHLPETYLAWAAGLILLYPICKTFEAFKHRMPANSVWRML